MRSYVQYDVMARSQFFKKKCYFEALNTSKSQVYSLMTSRDIVVKLGGAC